MTSDRVNLNRSYQFLILTILYTSVASIKVDFGTRGGPIIPPTSTTIAPPKQPYREPAPVWEDQSNDIADPRPYTYDLPPPSRSRENTLNIFDPNYKEARVNPHVTTQSLLPPQPSPSLVNISNQFGYRLVPIYIPGEGYRYLIAIPADKWNYLSTNLISDNQHQQKYEKYEKYDKYNGRYNAKLKKYKAYEKFLKPQHQQQQQQQIQQQSQQKQQQHPVKRDLLHYEQQYWNNRH